MDVDEEVMYDGHMYVFDEYEQSCVFCNLPEKAHTGIEGLIKTKRKKAVDSIDTAAARSKSGGGGGAGGGAGGRFDDRFGKKDKKVTFSSMGSARTHKLRHVMYTCGAGTFGVLGHGSEHDTIKPVLLTTLEGKSLVQIEAGLQHFLVLTQDGMIYTWGYGGSGQLGHSDVNTTAIPRLVTALQDEPCALIAAGASHSVALSRLGQVYVWGDNSVGQLGLGDTMMRLEPTVVEGLFGKIVVFVAAGVSHTGAVTNTGEVFIWGLGEGGRLGLGTEAGATVPTRVPTLDAKGIRQLVCGDNFTLAMTMPYLGLTADVATGSVLNKTHADGDDASFVAIAKVKSFEVQLSNAKKEAEEMQYRMNETRAAQKHVEALVSSLDQDMHRATRQNVMYMAEIGDLRGRLQSGASLNRQLIQQIECIVRLPPQLEELNNMGIKQIAVGRKHVLALMGNQDVYAFGDNKFGQLGFGVKDLIFEKPHRIRALSKKGVKQIACGELHSVALTFSGDVYCWGDCAFGQLGIGRKEKRFLPAKVRGEIENARVEVVGAGTRHTVCLTSQKKVYVWGVGDFGYLGRGKTTKENHSPAPLNSLSSTTADKVFTISSDVYHPEQEVAHDDSKRLGSRSKIKNDIQDLIDSGKSIEEIEQLYPTIHTDPAAALLLTKEMNQRLAQQRTELAVELQEAAKVAEEQLRNFVAEQDRTALSDSMASLRDQLGSLEQVLKARHFMLQQLENESKQLEADIDEIDRRMRENLVESEVAMMRSTAEEKAQLMLARVDVQRQLGVTRSEKQDQLTRTRNERTGSQKDVEQVDRKLKQVRVDIIKTERRTEADQVDKLKRVVTDIEKMMAEMDQANIEKLETTVKKSATTGSGQQTGINDLLSKSNEKLKSISESIPLLDNYNTEPDVCEMLQHIIGDTIDQQHQLNDLMVGMLMSTLDELDDPQQRKRVEQQQQNILKGRDTLGHTSATETTKTKEFEIAPLTALQNMIGFGPKIDLNKNLDIDQRRRRKKLHLQV